MSAFVVQVRRESLGSGKPSVETVCALGDDEAAVAKLVRTALRLQDEQLEIVRILSEDEVRRLGLRPFQVKHLS